MDHLVLAATKACHALACAADDLDASLTRGSIHWPGDLRSEAITAVRRMRDVHRALSAELDGRNPHRGLLRRQLQSGALALALLTGAAQGAGVPAGEAVIAMTREAVSEIGHALSDEPSSTDEG